MQCFACKSRFGAGAEVFERVGPDGLEYACSMKCANSAAEQGEIFSTWKRCVCEEDRVDLVGSVVTSAGFKVGKKITKKMTVEIPDDASIDRVQEFVSLDVDLILSRMTVRPLPEEGTVSLEEGDNLQIADTDGLLSSHGFVELKELHDADLFTLEDVTKLKSTIALMERTGWPRSRARLVMSKCKKLKQ